MYLLKCQLLATFKCFSGVIWTLLSEGFFKEFNEFSNLHIMFFACLRSNFSVMIHEMHFLFFKNFQWFNFNKFQIMGLQIKHIANSFKKIFNFYKKISQFIAYLDHCKRNFCVQYIIQTINLLNIEVYNFRLHLTITAI